MSIRRDKDRLRPVGSFAKLRIPVLQADGVVAGPASISAPAAVGVATLLTRQVLRDGEVVILILKPSRWMVALSSLRFIAAVLIAAFAGYLNNPRLTHVYVEAASLAVIARLAWATLQWMGRLYVLTDQRIVRIGGVWTAEIFECPLRRVARTRMLPSLREKLVRSGSIEIMPQDESAPCAIWQTIRRPKEVQEQIQQAIRRAKQGCGW
ncbi:MAG TPA: hypothetical protein VH370_27030 [Humisphaera sp.]|nr:hypothetical protein [Humisphaera sp.]